MDRAANILPQRGKGTIRRMVEGQAEGLRQTPHMPLHHFVVPLPLPGRI
jgi:hypothetical protein